MCGIAGIYSLKNKPIENAQDRITRMTSLLKHRGPDSQGIYLSPDKRVALGNTRLAIVDPNNTIKQPMVTPDNKRVLSFNGEIYNYLDVMNDLKQKGVRFKTKMDTEVLLEGLTLRGERFLEQLDGMWGFAYYDTGTKNLLLSRDLLGERHIFYAICGDEFIFSSEVPPILEVSSQRYDIDFDAFLTSLQYFAPPPGRTMVRGISRILPGHNIVINSNGEFKQYRYTRLHPEQWFDFYEKASSFDQVVEKFEDIFNEACFRRLSREVPYLCTLSGGLDSSVICLFASDFGKRKIKTLYGQSTDKPPQKLKTDLDELTASNLTAKKLNTDHFHTVLNSDDAIPVLRRLADNSFDGLYDSGVAAFEMLAQFSRREKYKVMLVSEGPDEFLGYPKDLKAYRIDGLYRNNHLAYRFLKWMSSQKTTRQLLNALGLKHKIMPPLFSYDPFRFSPIHRSWNTSFLSHMLTEQQIFETADYYAVHDKTYDDLRPQLDFAQMRALSYASYSIPDMFNLRTDKAYMRSSVEARLPYQASRMVEFMIAMPAKYRFEEGLRHGVETKYLLRKIVEEHISPKIAYRSKHGFAASIWKSPNVFKAMQYDEVVRASSIFDDFPFQKGIRDFVLHPDNHDTLWPFYVLARTHEQLKQRDPLSLTQNEKVAIEVNS